MVRTTINMLIFGIWFTRYALCLFILLPSVIYFLLSVVDLLHSFPALLLFSFLFCTVPLLYACTPLPIIPLCGLTTAHYPAHYPLSAPAVCHHDHTGPRADQSPGDLESGIILCVCVCSLHVFMCVWESVSVHVFVCVCVCDEHASPGAHQSPSHPESGNTVCVSACVSACKRVCMFVCVCVCVCVCVSFMTTPALKVISHRMIWSLLSHLSRFSVTLEELI
jgi:hypothetical protein